MDVGTAGAAIDPITPDVPWVLVGSSFTGYDLSGGSLGTFALTTDASDGTGLAGVAAVGIGGGDIAGFGLSSLQMSFEIIVVPTPAALPAGLIGLGALALRRRRMA